MPDHASQWPEGAAGQAHESAVQARPRPGVEPPEEIDLPQQWMTEDGVGCRLVSILGVGSMGVVYEAEWVGAGGDQRIALKLIRDDVPTYTAVVDRFRNEADLPTRLASNPNVLRVLGSGWFTNHHPYLAAELLRGGPLTWHRASFAAPARAVALMRHVAQAVEALHDAGILHRDLKPDNLMFRTPARTAADIVITDFGLARDWKKRERVTKTRIRLGSPQYAAPEQLEDARSSDHRADIFSLGAILFELLAGRPAVDVPYPGEVTADYIAARNRAVIPRMPTGLPEVLKSACRNCLQPNPAARYASVSELVMHLQEAADKLTAALTQ